MTSLTVCYNVCYSDLVLCIRILFIEEDCGCAVRHQAPIFHRAVRLAKYISIYSTQRSRGTYNSLRDASEGSLVL